MSDGERAEPDPALDEVELTRFRNYRQHQSNEERNQLVVSYTNLSNTLAQRFARRGETAQDLMEIAHKALIRTVECFDPDRGTSFVGFAVPNIHGEIKRHLRDRTWGTHVIRSANDFVSVINDATSELHGELHRAPTPAEVATRLGGSVDHVLEAIDARRTYRAAEHGPWNRSIVDVA